jgi:hypothetical protein
MDAFSCNTRLILVFLVNSLIVDLEVNLVLCQVHLLIFGTGVTA